MAGIGSDIQKLEPGALVELYTLDLTPLGGQLYRFHGNTNGLHQSVVWQGNTYLPFPIKASGFDVSGKGILPRPKLVAANTAGVLSALCVTYDDMVGAKFTRKRTFARYLDAVNFPDRKNLLNYTQEFFTAAGWAQSPAGDVAVTADATTAPDGTTTADKLYEESTGASWKLVYQNTSTLTDNTIYCTSVYAKAAERSDLTLTLVRKDGANSYCYFDLLTGTVGSASSGVTGRITPVGNGWYRCETAVDVLTGASTTQVKIALVKAGVGSTYAGEVGKGLYVWGAQLEPGLVATEYQHIASVFSRNPTADATAAFPDDIFYVEQKLNEDNVSIEWELASVLDFEDVQLPKRQIIANTCAWRYRGAECSYAGTNYFTATDAPTADVNQDVCSKRLAGCQARFGQSAVLPYGGFPGALRY